MGRPPAVSGPPWRACVANQTTLVDGQVITVAGAKLVFKCVS
jgi:hypothetical protein